MKIVKHSIQVNTPRVILNSTDKTALLNAELKYYRLKRQMGFLDQYEEEYINRLKMEYGEAQDYYLALLMKRNYPKDKTFLIKRVHK